MNDKILKSLMHHICIRLFIFAPMNKSFCQIFCFLILALNSFGQDSLIFNTRHLSVEDGLLGRRVSSMLEDDDGFIWIGTNEGLNRFDGYRFEHFTKSSHGLNANDIANIAKDDEGDIWITYPSDKLFGAETQVLRPSTRKLLSLKEKLGTQYKEEYKNLKLVNGTRNNCIFLISKTGEGNHYIYKNEKLTTYAFSRKTYNSITDELWIINEDDNKILKVDMQSGKILDTLKHDIPLGYLSIDVTNKGGCFAHSYDEAIDKSFFYYKGHSSNEFQEFKLNKKTTQLKNLTNSFYDDGLLYFEYNDRLITYNTTKSLPRVLRNSFFDNQGNLWLGTNDGIFILTVKQQRFKVYFQNGGQDRSLYDGRGIWADDVMMYAVSGSNSYRYQFKDETSTQILSNFSSNQNKPTAIIKGKDDSFWIGTKTAKLCQVDFLTGNVKRIINGCKRQIWALCEDKNNRIWIGQISEGLRFYEPDKMEETQKYNRLNGFEAIENGRIVHIIEDRKNNNLLWMSSQSGWYLLDINKGVQKRYWSKAKDDTKIFGDEIQYTYQDDDGVFWLATAYSGLVRVELSPSYEVVSTKQFTIAEGLSSNTVYAIYEDENDFLWVNTNNGINRFDKKTQEVQIFLEEDGLPHYEFNRLSNFQRTDGTIFFGTLNGIVSFHPKDLSDIKAYDVPLKISRCETYSNETGQMVNITADVVTKNKIVIAPNQQLTTLYVAIQDYADALKTKYIYRVKGVQKEFIAANKNEISLSGLPFGKYTLEIKAKAPDGRFSKSMIAIPLIIMRPFYLRWWFILLSLVSIALFVWQFFQIRTKALQNRKQELEEVVKARTQQLEEQASQLQLDKSIIEIQAKELRTLDEMKSQFFANISHELRTPLTLILSPAKSIIKRKKTDNRDFTSAQIIEQNANKLLKRINEILDLTKLEAHEMALKPETTPFYKFNKRLVATFESLAAQKNQKLTFKYQLDKDLNLMLDQDKYEHIFNNYLSNAIKFTPKSGIINIELSEQKLKNANDTIENHIQLSINDNGIGIHPDDLSKVFNRFYQTKNNKNGTGGSGIGLALSKEIALLMKGKAYVKSTVGKGSTFYFEMPYVEAVGSGQLEVSEPLAKPNFENLLDLEPSKEKPTILLVEDNPQLRNYIQLILQEKYNIITAENGQVALERLRFASYELRVDNQHKQETGNSQQRTRNPQLIISDIMMPIMNGFELLEQLKSSDAFRHIPVVMLTARSNIKDKLHALRIGVDDYILKPFQEEELLARIDNLIVNAKNRVITEISTPSTIKEGKSTSTITEADHKWLEHIEKRLKEEISNSKFNVETLSEELSISRSKLQRRIKKITGLTPVQYFRDIKLQAARELLENQQVQTINEVAYAVGFDTPAYFTKVFTKHFGKKPIEYLK